MNAASSDNPSAPGSVATGLKKRAISRSSAEMSSSAAIVLSGRAAEFARAQPPCHISENGIHHSVLVTLDKSSGNVSIFGNHDTRRHILPMRKHEGPRPQRHAPHTNDMVYEPD